MVVLLKVVLKSELLNVIFAFLDPATEALVICTLYTLLLFVSVTVILLTDVLLGSAFKVILFGFA